MSSFALNSPWLWVIGIAIVAVVLLVVGRLGARASVAGRIPPDSGPDLKPAESGQEPDIPPEDQSQAPPRP